jgi:hypothetical protein
MVDMPAWEQEQALAIILKMNSEKSQKFLIFISNFTWY